MAGGKETPRQKMIGMMYLVLTALLAMNAPKELINSFVVINEGLQKSNAGLEEKNKLAMESFKATAAEDVKFSESLKKAEQVQKESQSLYMHIEELKRHLIVKTEKLEISEKDYMTKPDSLFELRKVLVKDNYDVPTFEMIGSDQSKPRPATDKYSSLNLKNKIEAFKKTVSSNFDKKSDPNIFTVLEKDFSLEDINDHGQVMKWEVGAFYHLPLAAVITNLTRLQLSISNMEADAMAQLAGNVNKNRFKVDNLVAKVIPNSTYVMLGDSFKADIFIAASSSAIVPEVYVKQKGTPEMSEGESEKDKIKDVGGGIMQYGFKPGAEGVVEWGGFVKVKKPDGTYEKYPITPQTFRVAKAGLTCSPTKMNVFYRGLDNPVSISAPGVATEDLVVSCTNGTVSAKDKRRGEYVVKPGNDKACNIVVQGKINGKNVRLGEANFRVKDVPPPTPYFGKVTGSGSMTSNELRAILGVIAKLEDFDFEGVRYDIIEFSMSSVIKGSLVEKKTQGNKVTSEMKAVLDAAKSGSKIYIEGIKAKGPSGKVVALGSISIKVQ